jgi:hypothetical protein
MEESSAISSTRPSGCFQVREWYEKKAQTHTERDRKGCGQAGSATEIRRGTFSAFTSELTIPADFVGYTQSQMEDTVRDAFELALLPTPRHYAGGVYGWVQRTEGELQGFGEELRRSVVRSRRIDQARASKLPRAGGVSAAFPGGDGQGPWSGVGDNEKSRLGLLAAY